MILRHLEGTSQFLVLGSWLHLYESFRCDAVA